MAYPVTVVNRPAILLGQTNGKLDPSVLVDTPGLADGPIVRLVPAATRAWRALCAAALAAGHILKATSLTDSYRPYPVQERIFRERYTTDYLAGRPTRTWQGLTWYQRPNTAVAAVPGTSNHGWGLAVDTGEERDADPGTESLDADTFAWLLAHADDFGWSWETQSEPWHLRYWAGDSIPVAVLNSPEGDDVLTDKQARDLEFLIWRAEAIFNLELTVQGGPEKGKPNPFALALKALGVDLDACRRGEVPTIASPPIALTDAQAGLIGNAAGRKVLETLASAEEIGARTLREGAGGQ